MDGGRARVVRTNGRWSGGGGVGGKMKEVVVGRALRRDGCGM